MMTSFKSLKAKLIAFCGEHAYRAREDQVTLLLSLVLVVVVTALLVLVLNWHPHLSSGQAMSILLLVLSISILLYLLIYQTTLESSISIFYSNLVFSILLYFFLLGFIMSEHFVMLISGVVLGISEPNEKTTHQENDIIINTQHEQKLPNNAFEPLIKIRKQVDFFLFGHDYITRNTKNSLDSWEKIQKQHHGVLSTTSMAAQSDASTQYTHIVQSQKDVAAIVSADSPQVLKLDKHPKSILKTSVIFAGGEGETITKRVSFDLNGKEKDIHSKEVCVKNREL